MRVCLWSPITAISVSMTLYSQCTMSLEAKMYHVRTAGTWWCLVATLRLDDECFHRYLYRPLTPTYSKYFNEEETTLRNPWSFIIGLHLVHTGLNNSRLLGRLFQISYKAERCATQARGFIAADVQAKWIWKGKVSFKLWIQTEIFLKSICWISRHLNEKRTIYLKRLLI